MCPPLTLTGRILPWALLKALLTPTEVATDGVDTDRPLDMQTLVLLQVNTFVHIFLTLRTCKRLMSSKQSFPG
jgi:hypothetical protein